MENMEKHKLHKPLTTIDGECITEIVMNLDDLSRLDLEKCAKQALAFMGKKSSAGIAMEVNKIYQAFIAAKASGLAFEDIRNLGGRDYTQICLRIQNFLLVGESEEDEEEEDDGIQALMSGMKKPTASLSLSKTD